MKQFIKKLVNKYWKYYEKDYIGAGISPSYTDNIKKDIQEYLKNNKLYEYNYDEYQNDTDEYVKFSTYNEIMLLLAREIQREFNQDYNYPKRFQHSCGQRDW